MARKYKYVEDTDNGKLLKVFSPETNEEQIEEFDLNQLPDETKTHLLFYGARQKLSDAHSGVKDLDEIKSITQRVWDQLMKGEFRRVAEGGQPRGFELTVRALAKVKGMSEEDARATLEKFIVEDTDDEETAKMKRSAMTRIRQSNEIRDAIAEIKGEKQEGLDDLLNKEVA